MTNAEKYKTAKERANEFQSWCHARCANGKCERLRCRLCQMEWLDLEAEDEKPLPCPYCGSECFAKAIPSKAWVWCSDDSCGYVSGACDGEEEAVAAHNRVARAAAAKRKANGGKPNEE